MAINPNVAFPGKTAGVSADYPFGEARDVSSPGDGTGTPLKAALLNDLFGVQQALLSEAQLVPTGTPDTATNSQYVAAIKSIQKQRAAYETTAAMQADAATRFVDGMVLRTLAFNEPVLQDWVVTSSIPTGDFGLPLIGGKFAVYQNNLPTAVPTAHVHAFGAKIGDSSFDNQPAFAAAMQYLYKRGVASIASWPITKKVALVGGNGDYYFGSGFITPDFSAPNYVNYDIVMPCSTFRPMAGYDHTRPLIHAKACFDYHWEFGIFGFTEPGADYVIFNDSSREQNYGGKCTYKIKAADTDYVIRHELESVVASFSECMTNKNIKKFLRVWRCDQASIDRCYFNWEQGGRATYDSFIEWGKDDGATAEPSYPGNGLYNVGRLTVTNSMFIPNGTGVPRVHTGWFENVGGVINIEETCHFGPESNNRPTIVFNRSVGATFAGLSDQTESGIHIGKCSCASSWDLVYCISDYPNAITIDDVRWNTLDYSGGAALTYLIGGDAAALNAKTTKYASSNRQYFSFNCNVKNPSWKNINDVDPKLDFAYRVTEHGGASRGVSSFNTLPATTLYYDIQNRDGLMPAVPPSGVYEITNTLVVNSVPEGKTVEATMTHRVTLVKNGLNAEYEVEVITKPSPAVLGSTPSLVPVFVNGSNIESATALRSDIDSGVPYFMRFKYLSNNSGNTFTDENFRIKRII